MGKDSLVSITVPSIQECPYPYGLGKNCGFFTWALRFQNRLSHKFRRNIETDLDNNSDYDEHPIRVAGVDICFVAEKIFFALNVKKELTKLSK